MKKYDLIVIGGGPAGYAGALKAAQYGKKIALFEKEKIGGVCLNVGCIPTKALSSKAGLLENIRTQTQKEVLRDAGLFSYKKIQKQKNEVVNRLTRGVDSLLKAAGVDVFLKEAEIISPNEIKAGSEVYSTEYILIATGSSNLLNLSFDNKNLSYDSTGLLNIDRVPSRMVIIGAGVIGLEMASIFNSFGTKITIVELLPEILPDFDSDVTKAYQRQLEKRGIEFQLGSLVKSIDSIQENKKRIIFTDKDGQEQNIITDIVLCSIGRKPNVDKANAEKLNLKIDEKGFIVVNNMMQTNLPNIFAAGDITGAPLLAHVAIKEAEVAVKNMFSDKKNHRSTNLVPSCIYSYPALAKIGLTAKQAKEKNLEILEGVYNYIGNGMALALEETTGFAKIIVSKKDKKIVGGQILGEQSVELIMQLAVVIANEMTVDQWDEKIMVAHPTLSEILHEAIMDSDNKSIHTPLSKKS
ncbi:MAG TPA: dihydrolipoyl dehydrogenase [Clostridiaceae bacterium]|nr:dihydrolipoyl dehydrogenase [Clostridiaceae bacterium]